MHATKKNMQVFIGPVIEEGKSNRLKLYIILFAYSWGVQKSLFHFCSPNGFACHVRLFTKW